MKICMVTDTFWPRINGVSVSITALTKALRALGQEVYIAAPDYSRLPGRRQFIDGSTEPIEGTIRFPAHAVLFFPEDCAAFIVGRGYRRQVRTIRRMSFDIIHVHTPLMLGLVSMYWPMDRHTRYVHTFHTLFEEFIPCYFPFCYLPPRLSHSFAHWFTMNGFHWYCNKFDQIIAPSTQVADLLKGYYLRPPIEVLPTGIDIGKFMAGNGERIRQEWQVGPDDKLLLFVGRVGFEKGIDLLLKAMVHILADHPSARLVIVGRGPAEGALQAMAQDLQIAGAVRFVGYKAYADMADVYAAADLFLFSSQTESQGLVTVEAMAAGTPVVAVHGPGTDDLLQNERGGLLSPPDERSFAEQVVRLLDDPGLYAQKKVEARRRAEDFSSLAMGRRMLQIYRSLLRQ